MRRLLEHFEKTSEHHGRWAAQPAFLATAGLVVMGVLVALGHFDFLLFHALTELFSAAVCLAVFLLAWNTRGMMSNGGLLVIGISLAFAGFVDVLHTLAYKGMGYMTWGGSNLPTQLWIAGRIVQTLGLLALPFAVTRRVHAKSTFLAFAVVTVALLGVIFTGVFPDCFVEGQGLTPFKKNMEYLLLSAMLLSAGLLWRVRFSFDQQVFELLAASILLTAASELFFTFYVSVYGISNIAGHLLKVAAVYLVYRALIETGLTKPFALLFRELKQREEELTSARDAAERANQAKGMFLANVSHEVRTPLSGVMNLLKLLDATRLDPEQREYVRLATASSRGLLHILNDILDLSRIESGRMPIEESDFALKPFLGEIRDVFAHQARQRGIDFSLEIDPTLPETLHGDPLRIRQIIFNLAGNSAKFTEQGRIAIRAEKDGIADDGRIILRLTVSDTGPGIPKAQQESIFEPFVQADGGPGRKHGGTGLGLAIVRRLCDAMGGDIELESEPGTGTTFTVRLPLREGSELQADVRAEEFPAESAARSPDHAGQHKESSSLADLPPMRLLLADDSRVNNLALRRLLEKRGHEVLPVWSGQEALDALAVEDVDVVLMDVQMPGMDGIQATQAIRAGKAGRADVPILALTAHAASGDRERFLAAGMNDHVVKPVEEDDLARALAAFGPGAAIPGNRLVRP
ncbi:integral membrane sensor hybrid histidine kinase [Alkalidesulfovibrio alkalitolerans DSM 16529]|uniref:histidine kinase n=1 Tax=Alkalidesulfovibrio alkalitolerans DSM 16529 TaxID=1121439 RepID=S7UKJ4_9BACT|nr:MASE3 domain-containing protein [Alkalidesulfovibrio alkalitolerans]EPR32818.1 integral membrane sensor hybrid histidine kinase [Alkalidesulfovibrio alkalitolerans DSM 16529]